MTSSLDNEKTARFAPTLLPFSVDSLVTYGFSCAAVRHHCAYEAKCVALLNALVDQQRVSLKVPPGTDDPLVLLRNAPPQAEVAQLAAEVLSHRYYWSSLRHAPARPPRERFLRASLTQPAADPPAEPTSQEKAAHAAFSAAVETAFGSFDALQQQMRLLARTLHGAGWVWLLWDRQEQRLQLLLETGACCPLAVALSGAIAQPPPSQAVHVSHVSSPSQSSLASSRRLSLPAAPRSRASLAAIGSVASTSARRVGPAASRMWSHGVTRLSAALTPASRTSSKTGTTPASKAPSSRTVRAPAAAVPPAKASTESATPPMTAATPSVAVTAAQTAETYSTWTPRYVALFACDLWEHAYLRDFGLDRDAYVACFWRALDWKTIESRYAAATALNLSVDAAGTSPVASKL